MTLEMVYFKTIFAISYRQPSDTNLVPYVNGGIMINSFTFNLLTAQTIRLLLPFFAHE